LPEGSQILSKPTETRRWFIGWNIWTSITRSYECYAVEDSILGPSRKMIHESAYLAFASQEWYLANFPGAIMMETFMDFSLTVPIVKTCMLPQMRQ
jgi:hypothetical protein